MIKNKKSMKLNIIINFEKCKVPKPGEKLAAGERYDKDVDGNDVIVAKADPYSTKAISVNTANIHHILLNKGDDLDAKLEAFVKTEGSRWSVF